MLSTAGQSARKSLDVFRALFREGRCDQGCRVGILLCILGPSLDRVRRLGNFTRRSFLRISQLGPRHGGEDSLPESVFLKEIRIVIARASAVLHASSRHVTRLHHKSLDRSAHPPTREVVDGFPHVIIPLRLHPEALGGPSWPRGLPKSSKGRRRQFGREGSLRKFVLSSEKSWRES